MSIFLILLMIPLMQSKKKDLVDYIEKMKGKVVANNQIQNPCNKLRISLIMLRVL